jgi:hypothetical protein
MASTPPVPAHGRPAHEETAYTLSRPGRLMADLERCMAARLRPGRSGWSAAGHLSRDLERFFGVRAPVPSIEVALRALARRGRVRLRSDDAGRVWYRLVPDD